MKRLVILFLGASVMFALFAGCDINPRSKALVVINNSAVAIGTIEIREFVVQGSKASPIANALADGTTIPVGGRMKFYLAPYTYSNVTYAYSGYTRLTVEGASKMFRFNYCLNEDISATYDGSAITLTGSGVELAPPS